MTVPVVAMYTREDFENREVRGGEAALRVSDG